MEPAVCPRCSRPLPPAGTSCVSCGWSEAAPQVPLARIGLVKLEPRTDAPLELPPEDDVLGEEAPTRPGELPELRPTNPYPVLRAMAPAPAPLPPPGELALPPEEPSFSQVVPLPAIPSIPPVQARPSAAPAPPPVSSASGLRPALELPPDEPLPSRPSAPRPPRVSQEELAVVRAAALPAWLTDPLEGDARFAAGSAGALTALLAIDLSTAGRAEVGAAFVVVQVLAGAAATTALAFRHRLGLAGVVATGLLVALSSPVLAPAVVLWGALTLRLAWGPAPSRHRGSFFAGLGASVALLSTPMLDGVLPVRPAEAFSRAGPIKTPWVDQRTGVRLAASPLSLVEGPDATLRLPGRLELLPFRLDARLDLNAAAEAMVEQLTRAGLAHVTLGEAESLTGPFDAMALRPLTATRGRATVHGLLMLGVLGEDVIAVAASARAHRFEGLAADVRATLSQIRFRPPRRPSLPTATKRLVSSALVTSAAGTGVRLQAGDAAVLLLPDDGRRDGLQVSSSEGSFPVDRSQAATAHGLLVTRLGGGASVKARSIGAAPRLTRLVVASGGAFTGGWLLDERLDDERRVELPEPAAGPAFDTDGRFVGYVVLRENGAWLTPVDGLREQVATVAGGALVIDESAWSAPAPLFDAQPPPEIDAQLIASARQPVASVILVRGATSTAGAVIGSSTTGWILVADARVAAPGTTAVAVSVPDGTTRSAEIVRRLEGLALISLPRQSSTEFSVLPLADAVTPGRRVTWAFREDLARGATILQGAIGTLSEDTFELDPGPKLSGGPVMSLDGRLAGWHLEQTHRLVPVDTIATIGAPGLKDVAWRLVGEASGTCQLAATFALEDPLGLARLVRMRLEPASEPRPLRLVSAAVSDAIPQKGAAQLVHRLPCPASPHDLQFEVEGEAGTRVSRVQRLPGLSRLPDVLRGRSGPSPGAERPNPAFVATLWELPPALTLNHPCRATPALCERACAIEQLEACTLDGRYAIATKEWARAVSVLEPMCAREELEACLLLAWALDGRRVGPAPKTRPEPMLKTWCERGLERACAALAPAEWRTRSAPLSVACEKAPSSCDRLALHLLEGPLLEADVERALALLKRACAEGSVPSCGRYAEEALRLGRAEPTTLMPYLSAACERGDVASCREGAINPALGLTTPRTGAGAEQLLSTACSRGDERACLMVWRP